MMNEAVENRVALVVLSGLSGSGKTTALRALEDVGYFCVDNLPSPLMATFLLLVDEHPGIDRVAVAMDIREASYYPDLARRIEEQVSSGRRVAVLYLDCEDKKVVTRYKETRRRHPLMAAGEAGDLLEAIGRERQWLGPVRDLATHSLDTSSLTVHDLKRSVQLLFGEGGRGAMTVQLTSFGFRNGLPLDADFVFDVRFVPNPYFVEELREGTGLDAAVSEYVLGQSAAERMLENLERLLTDVLPLAEEEGKPSLTVAVGCTGGRHRSVAMVEELGRRLQGEGRRIAITHRDVGL